MVTSDNILQMLTSLSQTFPALERMMVAFASIAGFMMLCVFFHEIKMYGQMRGSMMGGSQAEFSRSLIPGIVAVMLLAIPEVLNNVVIGSLFGTPGPLSYQFVDGNSTEILAERDIVQLVQFFGLCSFIRGLFYLHRSGKQGGQPGNFGKSLTHIIGGALAWNIIGTVNVIMSTLGLAS